MKPELCPVCQEPLGIHDDIVNVTVKRLVVHTNEGEEITIDLNKSNRLRRILESANFADMHKRCALKIQIDS